MPQHIEYDNTEARRRILAALEDINYSNLTSAQREILDGLPDTVSQDQLAVAIQRMAEPATTTKLNFYAQDIRATLEARYNALLSETEHRGQIIRLIDKDGGLDRFMTRTIRLEGAAEVLRDILKPAPSQDKAA